MIAQLIRQDAAFRRIPIWAAVALVQVGVAAGVIAWTTVNGGDVGFRLLAALIWAAVALYLMFGDIGTRTNRFNLALPVAARQLWLSHFIAVGLAGVVVLAISAVIAIGAMAAQRKLYGGGPLEVGQVVVLGGLLVAALFLAVAIVHAFRPHAQEVPLSLRRLGWSFLAAVVPLGLALLLMPLGLIGVPVLLALAGVTFYALFRSIPEALSVPSAQKPFAEADEDAAATPEQWSAATPDTNLWMSLRTIHGVSTCAKKPFVMWVMIPFLILLALLISGIDARPRSARFSYPLMIVYVVMVVTALSVARLGVIDWLPWSRRRTFALLTIPLFLALAVGYGAGVILNDAGISVLGKSDVLCLEQNRHSGNYYLCVVSAASRISWSGSPPDVTTPWGETREPWNRPLIKGLPMRAYYPYSVHSGSTPEFAALQINRAVENLYGTTIPPDEIQSRYLREREDGSVAPAGEGLSLVADYGLRIEGGGVYFPWMMAGMGAMWSLLMAGYMSWLRSGVSQRKRKFLVWVFIAVPMLFWILDMFLEAFELSTVMARNTFFIEFARWAGSTPAATVAVWVGSALVAWGTYRLAERRFERAELNMEPEEVCGTKW